MKIAKAALVDPDRNFVYGACAVALSIFVFAYSSRFGQIAVLAYYAVWLPLLFVDHHRLLAGWQRCHWIIAFAALACLSVFWSAAPSTTARAAVQFSTHIVCALIAARTVSVRTLSLGAVVGLSLVVLYSFAVGHYNYDPLDGTYSFVGAFGSKNQIGLYASLGLLFAFAVVFILRERRFWLPVAIGSAAMCAVALMRAQSATSVLALVVTLAMLMCLKVMMRFSPNARKGALAATAIIAVLMLGLAASMGASDAVLAAFGKDATLTGRTYLWSEGMAAAAEVPFFGVGYQGYWVQGFSEAERLWSEFFIASRTGFHFHNTYVEVLVELGSAGLLALVLVILGVPIGLLLRLARADSDVPAMILFGVAFMFLVRSFVEVDVITPYVVGSFLLYYAAGFLTQPAPRAASRLAALVSEWPRPA